MGKVVSNLVEVRRPTRSTHKDFCDPVILAQIFNYIWHTHKTNGCLSEKSPRLNTGKLNKLAFLSFRWRRLPQSARPATFCGAMDPHTTPAGGARRGTGAQSLTKEKKEKGRPGAREGAAGGASPQHPRIAPMAARHSWISRQ